MTPSLSDFSSLSLGLHVVRGAWDSVQHTITMVTEGDAALRSAVKDVGVALDKLGQLLRDRRDQADSGARPKTSHNDGEQAEWLTTGMIRDLRDDALKHRDDETAELCHRALFGDREARQSAWDKMADLINTRRQSWLAHPVRVRVPEDLNQ